MTGHRRERRRRLVLGLLVAVVFAVANLVGWWALNQADSSDHVIFDRPAPAESVAPGGR